MIKNEPHIVCDICGYAEPAKPTQGRYNETEYTIPDGWLISHVNSKVHFCPRCLEKLDRCSAAPDPWECTLK